MFLEDSNESSSCTAEGSGVMNVACVSANEPLSDFEHQTPRQRSMARGACTHHEYDPRTTTTNALGIGRETKRRKAKSLRTRVLQDLHCDTVRGAGTGAPTPLLASGGVMRNFNTFAVNSLLLWSTLFPYAGM